MTSPVGVILPIKSPSGPQLVNQMLPSGPMVMPFMLGPMMPPLVAFGTEYWLNTPPGVSSPIASEPSSVHQSVPSLATVIWSGPWPVSVPDVPIVSSVYDPLVVISPKALCVDSVNTSSPFAPEGDSVQPVLEERSSRVRGKRQLGDPARRGNLADRVILRIGEIDVTVRPGSDSE